MKQTEITFNETSSPKLTPGRTDWDQSRQSKHGADNSRSQKAVLRIRSAIKAGAYLGVGLSAGSGRF